MKELDAVALKESKNGLVAGSVGTIVHEHVKGEMFVVEFCDDDGCTIALEDLSREQLERVSEFKA